MHHVGHDIDAAHAAAGKPNRRATASSWILFSDNFEVFQAETL
jgi:hypothetical protein